MSERVVVRLAGPDDLEACFALRRAVFMVEQGVSEAEEFDGEDHNPDKAHLIARLGDKPFGTARLWFKPGLLKIQRVCVSPEARGLRVGVALMEKAIEVAGQTDGVTHAALDSQTYAIGFYKRLGFVPQGPEFDDAGIPHRFMTRRI
ncbi:MAG: GNAT family N-acetyltransferase [Pseudomonadota bacterium]